MNNTYEMMYILRPDLGEEFSDQAIAKYENLLREQGGELIEIQHRGKRRLAYEINRQREGIYIQMNYKAPATHVAVIERAMRLSDDVIRYLTLKLEEPKAAPQPQPTQAEVEAEAS